jgi:ATP phosphoribosyltransferase regulatory subunit HisZ
MVEAAVAKDMVALKFFLERFYPQQKADRRVNASMRDLVTLADIEDAAKDVAQGMLQGEMCMDEAETMVDVLQKTAKIRFDNVDITADKVIAQLKDKGRI